MAPSFIRSIYLLRVCTISHEATGAGTTERIHPAVMAAECLGYRANTFDMVLGVSILHHTDPFAAGARSITGVEAGWPSTVYRASRSQLFSSGSFGWLTPRGVRRPNNRCRSNKFRTSDGFFAGRSIAAITCCRFFLKGCCGQPEINVCFVEPARGRSCRSFDSGNIQVS